MDFHYINFLDTKFRNQDVRNYLIKKFSSFGFKTTSYTEFDLDQDFLIKNRKHFEYTRGYGYFVWKPYLILKKIIEVNDGDFVFYGDCGDDFIMNPYQHILEKIKDNDYYIISNKFINNHYTKRDCFIKMNCDNEMYYLCNQIEAGVCGFKKTNQTISLLKEWLNYCSDFDIISDEIKTQNFPEFIDHRHDQSILTNLIVKYEIKTLHIDEVKDIIIYNKFF
jgi:hypothetical protein